MSRPYIVSMAAIAVVGCGLNIWRTVCEIEQLGDARLADAGKVILAQTANIIHDFDVSDAESTDYDSEPGDESPDNSNPAQDLPNDSASGENNKDQQKDGASSDPDDGDFAAERDIARIYTHTYASDLSFQVLDRSGEVVYAGLNSLGEKPRCGPENGYSVLRMDDGSMWSLLCLWTPNQSMRIEIGEPIANRRKLALAVGLKANLPVMVMLMVFAALYYIAEAVKAEP